MCGIFGCILREGSAVKQITEGLKRLEYRGYDSVGVATIDHGELEIRKDAGKIEDVVAERSLGELEELFPSLIAALRALESTLAGSRSS